LESVLLLTMKHRVALACLNARQFHT